MSGTVSIICYKSKKLSNGECPLMIRVYKDEKLKYQSLGISVKLEHWDFEKNRPKNNCPNRALILKIILEKETEFQKQILELKSEDKEYTASTLIEPKVKFKIKTVAEFYKEIIKDLEAINKIGNAKIYNDSFCSLKTFTNNKLDIPFSYIDINFLNEYEKYLRKRACKETSMSLFFRTLRSVYNKAIQAKHTKLSSYPFIDFKTSKFDTKTEKRAISKEAIMQIMAYNVEQKSEYMQLSKDLFIFSYLCGGINFIDMANLKSTNIVESRLIYIRQKTHKKINVLLNNIANSIIQKYVNKNIENGYIFPILDNNIHKTEQQKYYRRHKVLALVNNCLKQIAKDLGINANLTSYVARHSYATVLKKSGVSIALISETLGHADLKTTQIYLDSFDNEQIDKALENLL
jgi:site-specific recombinase XerD